jgi:hypothetical protein
MRSVRRIVLESRSENKFLLPGYGALLNVIENRMPRPEITYSGEWRTGK